MQPVDYGAVKSKFRSTGLTLILYCKLVRSSSFVSLFLSALSFRSVFYRLQRMEGKDE